jgi:thymidylate kinase
LTVALVGADGAGKTTVVRELARVLDMPVRCLYMGTNLEASGLMLPTTRLALARRRRAQRAERAQRMGQGGNPGAGSRTGPSATVTAARPGARTRVARAAWSAVRTANWIAEECLRQMVIAYHRRRGRAVLCDRHFFPDYYAHDVTRVDPARPVASRIHGLFLRRVYPRPELVVLLDAPAEALHARKPSSGIEFLAQRRDEYLRVGEAVERFEIVDATQPLPAVTAAVADLIRQAYHERLAAGRRRWVP